MSEIPRVALQSALAELWKSWGIRPEIVVGEGVADGRNGSIAVRIAAAHEQGCNVFLEIGPRPKLIEVGRAIVTDPEALWLASLDPERPEWEQLLMNLAALHERGVAIDWRAFDRDFDRIALALV